MKNVYYNPNTKLFDNSLTIQDDATIIYLPTITEFKGHQTTEDDFGIYPASWLNGYDDYIVKSFTLSNNKQVIIATYRYSDTLTDAELELKNTEYVMYINYALYGIDGTAEKPTSGIYKGSVSISYKPSNDNPHKDYINKVLNDNANAAASELLKYANAALAKTLSSADNGAILSKVYIKTLCAEEIKLARTQKNLLESYDKDYGTDYKNLLIDGLGGIVPSEAIEFFTDIFM